MDALLQDLRYAWRGLTRRPVFTAAAVLTFGVGIGLAITVFSVLDRVLIRALPYHDVGRLVVLRLCASGRPCSGAFPTVLADDARASASFEGLAVAAFPGSLRRSRDPDSPAMALYGVSANLLRVLGVRPAIGRDFSSDDVSRGQAVALISHESWQARFGGSDIAGKELWAGSRPVAVVGVLPEAFIPPAWAAPSARWEGLVLDVDAQGWAALGSGRGSVIGPVAKLRTGTTLEQARADVARLAGARAAELRIDPASVRVDLLQTSVFGGQLRTNFWLILGAASLLLLLACANLSTMLLSYRRSRERDAAVAVAIGGARTRLLRQAAFEAGIVCVLGSAGAVVVLVALSGALRRVLPPLIARYATGATDTRVLLMAAAAAGLCTLLAGVWPSLRATRIDVLALLQRVTASGRRTRTGAAASLLVVEAALGTVLVLSALLMLRTFAHLSNEDLGYRPEGLYEVTARPVAGSTDAGRDEQVAQALADVPDIASVAHGDSVGIVGSAPYSGFTTETGLRGGRYQVSEKYFDTLHVRFIAGRGFLPEEVRQRSRLAVLSASAAAAIWPGEDARSILGRVLALPKEPPFRVVGVVSDLKRTYGLDPYARPALYVPFGLVPARLGEFVVRTVTGTAPDVKVLRRVITDRVGASTVLVEPVLTYYSSALVDPRFRAVLFTTLALAGLLLSASGLYAVAALDVRQREYELGVRLSHGATRRDVQRLVLTHACRPVVAGLAIGFVGAYWATTVLQQFLYQVEPREPWACALVAAVILGTALLATWLPARRASRLDPAVVLRAP